MLVFMPWWMWLIAMIVVASFIAALWLWFALIVIVPITIYLVLSLAEAIMWRTYAPERRASWRTLYGIPDTPDNDLMCEPCFGRGSFAGGSQCPHCKGTGCRDGKPRNLSF